MESKFKCITIGRDDTSNSICHYIYDDGHITYSHDCKHGYVELFKEK